MRRMPWWLLAGAIVAWATLTSQLGPQRRPFVWCLTCGPNWLSDIVGNVALFLPLGAALVYAGLRPRSAIALGMFASMGIEAVQRLGIVHGRTASLSDIIANTIGTAIGALVLARLPVLVHTLVYAPPSRARLLLGAWTVACGGLLGASAWAVAPAVRTPSTAPGTVDSVKTSWMPTIPGREFIQSTIRGTVNGVGIRVKTTGQVVASIPPSDTVQITVLRRVIDERDRRDRLIFLVYLHGPATTTEQVAVGQFGDDLLLRSAVNASLIGLQTPALRVRGVFALDSVLMWKTTRIDARVGPGRLSLTVEAPDPRIGTVRGELALTPALGWALVQPIVGATARAAPLLTALWLLVWFLPGGLWLGRAITSQSVGAQRGFGIRVIGSVLWSALPLSVAHVAVAAVGVSPLSAWQMGCCVGGAIIGAVTSTLVAKPLHSGAAIP